MGQELGQIGGQTEKIRKERSVLFVSHSNVHVCFWSYRIFLHTILQRFCTKESSHDDIVGNEDTLDWDGANVAMMYKRKAIKTYPTVFTYGIWMYKFMDFKKKTEWVAQTR